MKELMKVFAAAQTASNQGVDADKVMVARYRAFFEPLLPPGWSIYDMQNNVYPFGHLPTYPDSPGFQVSFAGPEIPGQEQDAFTIWLMPLPYHAWPRNVFNRQAWRLGLTATHNVYQLQNSGEIGRPDTIKTWPTWQQDLVKYMKLQTKLQFTIVEQDK
jgi:hypothetical protein